MSTLPSQTHPQLSKSRFLNGLQCLKRLYLQTHHSDLADPVYPSLQAIFDSGTLVGELARERFPGGALVEEEYFEQEQAERTTRSLISAPSVPALYEPAFSFEGIRSRVDVLARTDNGEFDLIEVKSTTSVKKDVHIPDIAIQVYMTEGAGIPIRGAHLMHINRAYVYPGGDYDLEGLFTLADITDEVRLYMENELPGHLERMRESLQTTDTLGIETGRHCTVPYACSFIGHCHRNDPEYPVRELPNLRQPTRERLRELGIADIASVPSDFSGLSHLQRRVRDSVITGQPFVGSGLASKLREIAFPASFLDFETINPAIPMYAGTRPYQQIPFQWSLHVRDSDGGLKHSEFLHEGDGDPRERFITSLLAAIPSEGSIVTYSSYERRIMKELAEAFPQHRGGLLSLTERVFDLLQPIRTEYYHPGFHGSFSIKSVTPELVPDLAYDDLEIREGIAASASYARLITYDTATSDRDRIREALLAYCARDTEAMVRVFEALVAISDEQ